MKKYQIIYADPPWAYNSKRSNYINNGSGETLRHYDTLTIDELKEMPVKDINVSSNTRGVRFDKSVGIRL